MNAPQPDPGPGRPREHQALLTLALFVVTVLVEWRWFVESHEAIYLLGAHRVADPSFLARDLTWSVLSPTTFVYDHLLAPLWHRIGDFGIVAAGRIAFWALTVWSIVRLTRAIGLPPAATFAGYTFWMLASQRVFYCGSPFEGFQPKALAYPFLFFGLADAVQGRTARAGLHSGLATVLHVVVGGWGFLGIFVALALARLPLRRIAAFALTATPFVAGMALVLRRLQGGAPDEVAAMERIYVTLAAPHCCDPYAFVSADQMVFATGVFIATPALLYLWAPTGPARIAGHFMSALALFFALGLLARPLGLFGFLKLYPFQLANALPAMMLAMLLPAWQPRLRAAKWPARLAWTGGLALAITAGISVDIPDQISEVPDHLFPDAEEGRAFHYGDRKVPLPLYDWIRTSTPHDAVFVTPYLSEFWVCAERAQVACLRHPPFDHRLLEWYRRLQALNRFEPFEGIGLRITPGLSRKEARLSASELIAFRDSCGATHYLAEADRSDLAALELHAYAGYHVYDLAALRADTTAATVRSAKRQVEGVPVVEPEQDR